MSNIRNHLLVLLAVVATAMIPSAFSDNETTTYTVFNVPEMRLNEGISATDTSFDIAAPIRNGEKVLFPVQSGGILELKNTRFQEYIHFTGTTIDYSTKVTTLNGVTRGYCWNENRFASCESGRVWAKGTQVTLVDDMRLFNFAAKTDQSNEFTASGAMTFSGSGSLDLPTFDTTAERDAQLGASGSEYRAACVTATGLCYLKLAGTWTQIGDTGTSNATTTTAGKVELAGSGDTINTTGAGDSGAETVLTAVLTTMTGGTALDEGEVPILNQNGVLNPSLGGTGSGNLNLSGALIGNGTGAVKALVPTAENQILKSNAVNTWTLSTVGSTTLEDSHDKSDSNNNFYETASTSFEEIDGTDLKVTSVTADADTIFQVLFDGGEVTDGGSCGSARFDIWLNGVAVADDTGQDSDAGFERASAGEKATVIHTWKPGTQTGATVSMAWNVSAGTCRLGQTDNVNYTFLKIQP